MNEEKRDVVNHTRFQRTMSMTKKFPQTQREFESLLDSVRPNPTRVEVIFYDHGAKIMVDDEMKHFIDSSDDYASQEEFFKAEVKPLMDFYKKPPRLWPGCRGAVAKKLRSKLDVEFNRWFDEYAGNKAKQQQRPAA